MLSGDIRLARRGFMLGGTRTRKRSKTRDTTRNRPSLKRDISVYVLSLGKG